MPSLEQLEKLLAIDPNDAFVLYGIAQEYFKQRKLETAVEYYDRCLKVDPAYCYAYFHKARTLDARGDRDQAVETLRKGMKQAQIVGDGHALSEMSGLLDELT